MSSKSPRKLLALKRLFKGTSLTPELLAEAPQLPLPDSRKDVIDAMRFSCEPSIISFLKTYDAIPSGDRAYIPLEAVVLKANLGFNELLGAIVMCFRSLQAQKSALMAMAAHPKVLNSTILYAGMPGGERDRRMLHEAVGFLPTPKGLTINQNFGGNDGAKKDDESDDPGPVEVNDLFPMINESQEEWQRNRTKTLEAKN